MTGCAVNAADSLWETEAQTSHMVPLSLKKAIDDGSESTHSGSPSEPPMSPEPPKPSTAPGKLLEFSPACSTLGSKSTCSGASPVTLNLEAECLPSPATSSRPPARSATVWESSGSRQLAASFGQVAAGIPFESHSSSAVSSSMPPPPCYYAPILASTPGAPPAPMLPPGVPEPPRAPPRLPANVPMAASHNPLSTWSTAAASAYGGQPLQLTLSTQAPAPGGMAATLGTTPVSAYHGAAFARAEMQQRLGHLQAHMVRSYPVYPSASSYGAVASPSCGPPSLSLREEEVVFVSQMLSMLERGPNIQKLPPTDCYGKLPLTGYISESLGEEAGAVAEAARKLGYQPVKVLLPRYPLNTTYDPAQPAKVQVH